MTENPARPATQARRLAAINRIHLEHHHRPPGADPTLQTAITALPTTRQPAPDPAIIDQALNRIPVGGWPTAMFGRRDALLLMLRYRARLTLTQLVTLTSDDLHLDQERQLRIATQGHTVVLPPTDGPGIAIHPDRSAVLVDTAGNVQTLWPAADGLYDLGALGMDQ